MYVSMKEAPNTMPTMCRFGAVDYAGKIPGNPGSENKLLPFAL
jgi:hypothetical protein